MDGANQQQAQLGAAEPGVKVRASSRHYILCERWPTGAPPCAVGPAEHRRALQMRKTYTMTKQRVREDGGGGRSVPRAA